MSHSHHSPLPNGEAATHQIGAETPGLWRRLSTTQTMHDGTVLLTWGVQVSSTQQWVGKVHAVGPSLDEKAEILRQRRSFCRQQGDGGPVDGGHASLGRSIRGNRP